MNKQHDLQHDLPQAVKERHLALEGGFNFRELGGIKNKEGKTIKRNKIYRADDLYNLTDGDLNILADIPLITIVDFRSEEEMANSPDISPVSLKAHYALSINPGRLTLSDIETFTPEKAADYMKGIYYSLVTDDLAINQYKKFFGLLQEEANIPLLFHCTAGKDRTGVAAALFLIALGVDKDIIMQDYMASNIYLDSKYARYKQKYPSFKVLFEVQPDFLELALNTAKEKCGSVESFLTGTLEVDIEKLKKMYLE